MASEKRRQEELLAISAIYGDDYTELPPFTGQMSTSASTSAVVSRKSPWKITWASTQSVNQEQKPEFRFSLLLGPLHQTKTKHDYKQQTIEYKEESEAAVVLSNAVHVRDRLFCRIHFRLPRAYPDKDIPHMIITDSRGLSALQIRELTELLNERARELLGSEMIFELATMAQEFLSKISIGGSSIIVRDSNADEISVYDQMKQRHIKEDQAAESRLKQQLIEAEEKNEAEALALDELINEDLNKKRLLMKERIHQSQATNDTSQPGAETIPSTASSSKKSGSDYVRFKLNRDCLLLHDGEFFKTYISSDQVRMYSIEVYEIAKDEESKKTLNLVVEDVKKLLKLRHSKLVQLIHYSTESLISGETRLEIWAAYYPTGVTLETFMHQTSSPLDAVLIKKIMTGLLEALVYLHSLELIHGYICAEAILLCEGTPKLQLNCTRGRLAALILDKERFVSKIKPAWKSDAPLFSKVNDVFLSGLLFIRMSVKEEEWIKFSGHKYFLKAASASTQGLFNLIGLFFDPANRASKILKALQENSLHINPLEALISRQKAKNSPECFRNSSPAYGYMPIRSRLDHIYSSQVLSRYETDFEELEFLGRGGFGDVVKARNRLDGRTYALKKIRLDSRDSDYNKKILREVTTLSLLHHEYVVRYYQAWLESSFDEDGELKDPNAAEEQMGDLSSAGDEKSVIFSDDTDAEVDINLSLRRLSDWLSADNPKRDEDGSSDIEFVKEDDESNVEDPDRPSPKEGRNENYVPNSCRVLYIQMEYCENKTLKNVIDEGLSEPESWRLFRQILEGLVHIHSQGIIHRDLKPTNIFLDSHGDVKIGDFGLATQLDQPEISAPSYTKNRLSRISTDDLNELPLTSGIGTSFYIAPELLNPQNREKGRQYNQKADMYSLGIIFFECIYRFQTAMERIEVLQSLTKPLSEFPNDFDCEKYSKQHIIIQWLLKHSPKERPTSIELLRSEHLPPKIEDEFVSEALRTIATPNTPYYARLMSALFSQYIDKHSDYTFDFNSGTNQFDELQHATLYRVKDSMVRIFRRHSAIELTAPLLMPKSNLHEGKTNVTRLMDQDGGIVELPYDLTIPFARWISRSGISYIRRFCFGKVYRQNLVGGQPRSVYELDFDIVHSKPCGMVYDAEVLKIVSDVFEEIPALRHQGFYIKINHGLVLNLIFETCNISLEHRGEISLLLSQIDIKISWRQLKQQLLNQYQLPEKSVDLLGIFVNTNGDLSTVSSKLRNNLQDVNGLLSLALSELSSLLDRLIDFGIKTRVSFEPTLAYNFHYYKTGLIFQFVRGGKRTDILAGGGRYDSLISHFLHPTAIKHRNYAVGVNIAIGKVCSIVHANYVSYGGHPNQRRTAKYNYHRNHESMDELNAWLPRTCEVLITSFSHSSIADRIQICRELWNTNTKADYSLDDSADAEEVQEFCQNYRVPWLVILKDRVRDKKTKDLQIVKVKSLATEQKHEVDIARQELAEYLVGMIQERMKADQERMLTGETQRRERTMSTALESAEDFPFQGHTNNTGHVPALTVSVFLNSTGRRKMKASKMQLIADKAQKTINIFMSSLKDQGHNSRSINILALDLRISVIHKIIGCEIFGDPETFRREVTDYFPALKDYLLQILETLKDLRKTNKGSWVFLYSFVDDRWELLQL